MLSKALEKLRYDVRMKDWNQMQGLVTEEDLKKHNDSLPDLSARIEKIRFERERGNPEANGAHHS